jgi:hypothetical protein
LAWAAFLVAAMGDKFYLVKVVDYDKSVNYEMRSEEEWKTLQGEIKADLKFYQKALDGAKAEWRKDERTAKKAFPQSAIGQKEATLVGSSFTDQQRAQAKLDDLLGRSAKKEASRLERQKRQEDDLKKANYKNKNAINEQIKRDADKAKERESFELIAVQFFRAKLDELKAAAANDATPRAAQ